MQELKYKESDRLKAIYENLSECGVEVHSKKNNLVIIGNKTIPGGCIINAKNDHRIAMAFNILSLISTKPIRILGNKSINTSFPDFFSVFENLGVTLKSYG